MALILSGKVRRSAVLPSAPFRTSIPVYALLRTSRSRPLTIRTCARTRRVLLESRVASPRLERPTCPTARLIVDQKTHIRAAMNKTDGNIRRILRVAWMLWWHVCARCTWPGELPEWHIVPPSHFGNVVRSLLRFSRSGGAIICASSLIPGLQNEYRGNNAVRVRSRGWRRYRWSE
ncbi:hypothetical protein L227DRAFT_101819 [Lentinus tigrinus ALCF2SS1-6]|uniref:Uncharacterized protein n=1 Tax=Lentinus tigrinus ALCF2SS1-6 TaxID=1328759 RepID=A0A5C2S9E5_9APHY|nr:hypothetical protein L227DRAFT_101819 [Lentinus tigrinus ALCF2SS1-6]